MPFRDHVTGERYLDFEDCKKKNQDKRSPGGYCATSKRISEDQPGLIDEIQTPGEERDLLQLEMKGFNL